MVQRIMYPKGKIRTLVAIKTGVGLTRIPFLRGKIMEIIELRIIQWVIAATSMFYFKWTKKQPIPLFQSAIC